ncbi:hypothetical protein Glove_82g84 [Diversispora epigaea]|uniref:Uncharacterized protein n=1 Tax=Diversispora epigaea TaxID=1348612 RepID=A0A397JCB9_9GLOM|nr:hypothetical protein Glove_82g84 [Diversispora epigaea]
MPCKKNKKSASSINTTNPISDESQFTTTTCAVTATELQEFLQQGVKLKKINQALEYNRDTFKQDGFESRAEYYKNKIEDCVFEYLSQVGENKKEWLTCGAVGTLRQEITSQKVLDLLDIAKNKGLESPGQIII